MSQTWKVYLVTIMRQRAESRFCREYMTGYGYIAGAIASRSRNSDLPPDRSSCATPWR